MKRRAEGATAGGAGAAPTTGSSANYASSYQLRQGVAQRPPSGYFRKTNNGAASTTVIGNNTQPEEQS